MLSLAALSCSGCGLWVDYSSRGQRRREASAAAGTNPARDRRLTTAGRTGRISCFVQFVRKKQWRHSPGFLPVWLLQSQYCTPTWQFVIF